MYIINTFANVRMLHEQQKITQELAQHLVRKITSLQQALEPDIEVNDFSLVASGSIGILTEKDHDLSDMGLPASLDQIMPEWVSRLELNKDQIYYIVYCMSDNDQVQQIYLPDALAKGAIYRWLSEQPVEEEGDDQYADQDQPF
jgi:hypothetical protein